LNKELLYYSVFSVVADEFRKLAEASVVNSKEISGILQIGPVSEEKEENT
jgi:methyl-accepting chemotaxis protein